MFSAKTHLFSCLLLVAVSCGCGGKYKTYSVQGRVTLADGTPVDLARLTFECQDPKISATALTGTDGNYRLGTVGMTDGAPAGKYRVVVAPAVVEDRDKRVTPTFHSKYYRLETSPLEFTVEKGKDNTFDIKLDPPE